MKNIFGVNVEEKKGVYGVDSPDELKSEVAEIVSLYSGCPISEGLLSAMTSFVMTGLKIAYEFGVIKEMPTDIKVKIVDDKAYIYHGDILIDEWIDMVWK